MQSITYKSSDNINLHYYFWPNEASQSCCLMLHGFTNDASIWMDLAEHLRHQCNVIALDFRGHGDSDWDPEHKYTHDQLVEDIQTLIQTTDFSRWHIIGHSLGARAAILKLARSGFQPDSLTIIDTGPEVSAVGVNKVRKDAQNTPKSFPSIEAFQIFLSNIYLLATPEKLKQMAEYGVRKDNDVFIPKTDPAFTSALWKTDQHVGDSSDLRFPMNEELWQSLSKISCPTLVLRGQASAILSRQTARKMAEEYLARGELQTISRAGHALMVDNPEEFESAVIAFIKRVN